MNKDRGQIRKKEENYRKKKRKKATLPARRFRQTSDRFHGPWIGEEKRRFLKGIRGTWLVFYRISRQVGKLSLSAGFYKPDRFVAASLIALSCFFRVD